MTKKMPSYHKLYDEKYYKQYDSTILKIVPYYPRMHQKMLKLINQEQGKKFNILDVGCGTGTLSQLILDQFPKVEIVGIDNGKVNTDKALTRLKKYQNFACLTGDLRITGLNKEYDYVISALTLHHISDSDKRIYFNKIHKILKENGRFIVGDIVKSEEEHKWHQYLIKTLGKEGEKSWQLHKNNPYDKLSTLEDQLKWLRESGFRKIDVISKWFNFYVFYGEK